MRIVLSLLLLMSLNVAAQESAPAPTEPPATIENKEVKSFEDKIYYSIYFGFGGATDATFEDAKLRASGQNFTGKYTIKGNGGYVLGADANYKFDSGLLFHLGVERVSLSATGEEIDIKGGAKSEFNQSSNVAMIIPQLGVGWAWTNIDLFLTIGRNVSSTSNDLYKNLEPTDQTKITFRYRFEKLYLSLTSRYLTIPSRTVYYTGGDYAESGKGGVGMLDISLGYRFK